MKRLGMNFLPEVKCSGDSDISKRKRASEYRGDGTLHQHSPPLIQGPIYKQLTYQSYISKRGIFIYSIKTVFKLNILFGQIKYSYCNVTKWFSE